ncbi:MAG: carboxypeptidase regulatory-like domain-containing protein [Candidatus Vogelbacteria bacterium]|nr:carboxypeptidase regulatory-like domain-containing protein [Candidatus Vogelbacteria bacterium]
MVRALSIKKQKPKSSSGFTLIEVLVGAFILLVVVVGAYQAFAAVMKAVVAARVKTEAMMLANEQIEIARNLPYGEVGIVAGVPAGKIPREQSLVRSGKTFKLTASVRNIDDPFDGTLGSTTKNDLAPADYKQVEFIVSCESCATGTFTPQSVVTTVSPRNLETASGNGSLFVRVFNANGDPVSGATIRIQNDQGSSPIDISEVSNSTGIFQLVDTPPGALAYRVTVSKTGYSSDGTIVASVGNPNPLIPPATVAGGQLTQLSFAIDQTSHLQVRTINSACASRSGAAINLAGQKRIGQTPTVYKYDNVLTSDGTGLINLPTQEWDTYQFLLPETSNYALAGSLPINPLRLSPGTDQEISLVLVPKQERELLVVVVDATTGLPLSGALVTVSGETLSTSQGYFSQTDWSSGAGQAQYTDFTKFAETDSNLETASVPGEVRLRSSLGQFLSDGYL